MFEKMLFQIIAAARSNTQKGDISKQLIEQGFFDEGQIPESFKNRNKQLSGGNPVDVKKDFFRQNPN